MAIYYGSNMHRSANRRHDEIYESWYEFFRHDLDHPFTCFYCGQPADAMDHVPPISRVNDYRSLKLENEVFVKVPACRECNSLAGDTLQNSIVEREEFVKDRLARRYRHLFKCLNWTEDLIKEEELKGGLKRYCRQEYGKKTWIAKRMRYFAGVRSYLNNPKFIDLTPQKEIVKNDASISNV